MEQQQRIVDTNLGAKNWNWGVKLWILTPRQGCVGPEVGLELLCSIAECCIDVALTHVGESERVWVAIEVQTKQNYFGIQSRFESSNAISAI